MNPTGSIPPSPASIRRRQITTLFLLGGLALFFLRFLSVQRQQIQYEELIHKGSVALARKDVVHARGFFDAVIRANPTSPLYYFEISNDCVASDQPALALEYAQRGLDACKKAPRPERALLYLGLSQAQALAEPAHPQTKAIASARIALSLDPENPVMKNAVGYTLADNDQNLDEAEKLLREVLQALQSSGNDLDPYRSAIEDSFGWLLYKKGNYADAVAELNQAVADLPSGAEAGAAKYYYYHLGAAYRKAGKPDDTRQMLAIALHYDPDFSEAKAEAALLPPPNTPAVSPDKAPSGSLPTGSASPTSSTPPASAPGLKL